MRRFCVLLAAAAALALGALPAAAAATPGATPARTAPSSHSAPGVPGLPSGAPEAATEPEPALPAPSKNVWPFGEHFSRTSGAGRLDGGASYWSDFVYDAYGALGVAANSVTRASSLGPTRGSYTYPSGPAKRDGADIFRTAVGTTPKATYWRVDWNTLADPKVPLAEWTFDTDGKASTGSTSGSWPANAGVRSPGIDEALVVSSRGAWLYDASTGKQQGDKLHTYVDKASRSFVVKVPTSRLKPSGTWTVRMAAGLANDDGTGFATVGPTHGALPGQPNIYNVGYRSRSQEPAVVSPLKGTGLPEALQDAGLANALQNCPKLGKHSEVTECANFWNENDQAQTLAVPNANGADISKFQRDIDWSKLAAKDTTAEPHPTGYSVRWYVSRLHLGQGIVTNSEPQGDLKPNYLGRIQPYVVDVPSSYDPSKPTPLTWVLHSLGANHNQYAGIAPAQLTAECEDRGSICATTLGFGPDGWYFDEAEVDFWQVWHALATTYDLDPDATVISGYSMGGYASYKLGLAYPDLFAKAVPLEGPPVCGVRAVGPAKSPGASLTGGAHCKNDSDTEPLIGNARWLPYVMTYGVIDELVPITGGVEQVQAYDDHGYRYHAVIYPTEDHLVFATQNDFRPATSQIGHPRRRIDPGQITYAWYPDLTRADYEIGPTGDYWVRGLSARDRSPGTIAKIDAKSHAIPDRKITVHRSTSALAKFQPTPAVVRQLTWSRSARPARRQLLTLDLHDVSALGVDTDRAGLSCPTIKSTSDGRTTLRLLHLDPGTPVYRGHRRVTRAGRAGTATVPLATGRTTLTLCRPGTATGTGTGGNAGQPTGHRLTNASPTSLASTGWGAAPSGAGLALAFGALLVLRRRRRRKAR